MLYAPHCGSVECELAIKEKTAATTTLSSVARAVGSRCTPAAAATGTDNNSFAICMIILSDYIR